MSQRLAEELNRTMQREHDLFAFTSDVAPVLILLDRRDDPVTPLLNQWTYQAMVHELLSINNHRVDLSKAQGIKKEMQVSVCVCVCVCMYRNLEAYVAPLFVLIINTGDVIVMSLFLFPIYTHVHTQEVVLSPQHDEFYREVSP